MKNFKTKAGKLLLLGVISLATISSNAGCLITSKKSDDLQSAFDKYGGWTASNFEEQCLKLKSAHARLVILGQGVVLANSSIAWSQIFVADETLDISTTDFSRRSLYTNSYASQDKADELLVASINDNLKSWKGIDEALAALDVARKEAQKAYRK